MGIDDKRPLTSREPLDIANDDAAQQDTPEQPLDERASTSPATPEADDAADVSHAPEKPSKRSKRKADVTRPLTLVRVQSRPKQLGSVSEGGTPDWSLSAGVATVLFGFVIAFGTYATLTQREAVQSRLRHFVSADKPHVEKQEHAPAVPSQPAVDIAQVPPAPVDNPPVSVAVPETAALATPASDVASPSTTIARNAPAQPPVARPNANPSPALPKAVARRAEATTTTTTTATTATTAAPVREAPKTTALASTATANAKTPATTTTAQVRTAPAAQKDRQPNPKVAKNTSCGSLKSCDEVAARDERAPREPLAPRPPARSAPTTAVIREAAVAVPPAPAAQIALAPAQAEAQTETANSFRLSVNKDLFRQH
ncbi:hypothetical protein [Burkholderia sp. Ac-20365]|uniref:hypothetical protein n=1 Tax=Burkholderia sp. Ac-20365 TaxID=2703897 RepID=UPI00197B97B8|nr:hypothetical protein [Burkholderia sp. Ac-20365]MBN3764072.1 hypothetical protein [Burkholderia sp. Ac-20365]